MTAASATNGFFDQTASELKKIRNVTTPSGAVMKVTATDLKWFNHFYTFTTQGNACFQGMETIAREMGISSISTVQDRISKLVTLGFLTVEKKKTGAGWVNSYTTIPVDIIVSMMTDEPVTKQQKVLKKSQLKSHINKSTGADIQRVINNIKAAALAVDHELTDDEAIRFALCAAEEKLSVLGWASEVDTVVASVVDEEIDEHANDLPVQNDGYQDSDDQAQTVNDCHVIGSPTGTSFTSVFAVVPVIEDAFSVAETFAVDIPDVAPKGVERMPAVLPHLQGDDEFSIWCSVAERDQLKIPVIDILKGCNGDRDKAAASVKLMIDHTRKRRKEEQQRQIEHLVNEDTSAYSLLDEEPEDIPF
jgi:predicted transcriptional regulator